MAGIKVNGREYEWGDIQVLIGGQIVECTAIDYGEEAANALLYARGNKPHSHQRGAVKYPLMIELLDSSFNSWRLAVSPRRVTQTSIVVILAYIPEEGGVVETNTWTGFLPASWKKSKKTNTPSSGTTVVGEALDLITV